jgi:hypothetical protein
MESEINSNSNSKAVCESYIMWMMRHCSMMHQWLQRNDSNFYWLGICILVQRQQKKTTDKNEYYIEKYQCLQQCCSEVL